MNILIVGEYSGVAQNLKSGFSKLGHNVIIISYGDGWKSIALSNEDFGFEYRKNIKIFGFQIRGSWRASALLKYFSMNYTVRTLKNCFDLIFIMNYEFIRLERELSPKLSFSDIAKIKKRNSEVILLACGDDYPFLTEGNKMRYWPYSNMDISKNRYFNKRSKLVFNNLSGMISMVIPAMYEYAQAYRNCPDTSNLHITNSIPLPINLDRIVINQKSSDKVVIFHGLNREEFKGTDLIQEALTKIQQKYADSVEIIIGNRLPITQYLKLISTVDIVVDQCKSYSYGMNAIFAMAYGKVVFSGNEWECKQEFGRADIPVVNIRPEVNHIYRQLEKFILNSDLLKSYGMKSRQFVSEFHNDEHIARQYLHSCALLGKNV